LKTFYEFRTYLEEKLIIINNGKKYGQIVFMAGGGASGKGFAVDKFMEGEKYKIRDIDEYKKLFLKLSELKNKYPEIRDLNLRIPGDVFKLHTFVTDKNIKDKTLDLLLKDAKKDTLPNIIFDITFDKMSAISDLVPRLVENGYELTDIHLVWVLQNYRIAINLNSGRKRVVPEDIMLQKHEGAALNFYELVHKKVNHIINGSVYVILNNPVNTIYYGDEKTVIKDFKYLKLKDTGKSFTSKKSVMKEFYRWIVGNIPKTDKTKEIFDKLS
jgi:hypothetical protein